MAHDPHFIFCLIISGKADAYKVYEDENTLVFMDIFPVADGHTLLIPKDHCRDLFDAKTEALTSLIATSKRVAAARRGLPPSPTWGRKGQLPQRARAGHQRAHRPR